MIMDKTKLIKLLHDKTDEATTLSELQIITHCLRSLQINAVKVVTTYADLLQIFRKNGEVCFVESEELLYYWTGETWQDMHGESNIVMAWGSNNTGQLGDNTAIAKSSPVVGLFTDWISASAGFEHSVGVRANGTLWAWGNNVNGRLGDGTITNKSSPVSVVGGFTDWINVSTGEDHSIALRANGTLWAWGFNGSGRLGDGTVTNRSSPVSVVGGFTDWISVSAARFHSVGLRSNGTLWAWGYNNFGHLGDGTQTSRQSPVLVVGGFTDWVHVDAQGHNVGVRSNGTLWAWGWGGNGRLGDGTTAFRLSPVSVVGGFTDWVSASAGESHSIGLRSNGTLWAWGLNNLGQIGDGTTANKSSPVSVVGGFTDWVSASAGLDQTLALRANGTLWAWGSNESGRLGDGTTTNKSSPVSVIGGFTDWISASSGDRHSIGIR